MIFQKGTTFLVRRMMIPPRSFSMRSFATNDATTTTTEWRQEQLKRLERKFQEEPTNNIESDEELQPMWKDMESRVTKRRSRTLADTGGKTGRSNIRKTDEEAWLQAGMYDEKEEK